jgi:hypothetical protein
MKKILLFWILLVIFALSFCDKSYSVSAFRSYSNHSSILNGRPIEEVKVHTIGRVWSAVSNYGTYGDPLWILPGYDWPGGTGVFYLWEGRIWIGAIVDGVYYVSHADYGNYEFAPSVDGGWVIKKPGKSMQDIECKYDDWCDRRNDKARQLGLKIIQRAMVWSIDGYNDFIAYEYRITYNADSSFHKKDTLEDIYVAWVFDDDSGGRIVPDSWLDDLTAYDGWTPGEVKTECPRQYKPPEWLEAWCPPDRTKDGFVVRGGETIPYPYDHITLYPPKEGYPYGVPTDTTNPDGVLDQMTVFGDEPDEHTVHGDTLIFWRNISYLYDGKSLTRPDADETGTGDESELGRAPGYVGARIIYAPPISQEYASDTVEIPEYGWLDGHGRLDPYGDIARVMLPYSHQWWNWSNDPGSDEDKMLYMLGKHPFSRDKRFMGHPFDWGADVMDYRFMHTYGPYKIGAGDTIDFVWAGFIGFGLNGGYGYGKGADEGIFEKDKWYPGARWVADQAIKAYYMGSQHSDPLHPSAPSEDIHWLIPVPPETPYLEYSAGLGKVTLAWTDIAERTPDPVDGEYDFEGYKVYKAEFRPGKWVFLKGFVDSVFAAEYPEDYPKDSYDWVNTQAGEKFPLTYVDEDVTYGIPYLYAVTTFDAGRDTIQGFPIPDAEIMIPSLESGKSNYKKTEIGAAIPTFVKTPRLEEQIVPATKAASAALTAADLDRITVAPNPYIGSVPWERKYEDRIQFMNLPGTCRIRIYTVSGDLIKEIEHTDGTGDEYWDLLSRNNQDVVSGLYIYKIEAWDERGNPIHKIGKFVIVR